jgi:hypothetical protein
MTVLIRHFAAVFNYVFSPNFTYFPLNSVLERSQCVPFFKKWTGGAPT